MSSWKMLREYRNNNQSNNKNTTKLCSDITELVIVNKPPKKVYNSTNVYCNNPVIISINNSNSTVVWDTYFASFGGILLPSGLYFSTLCLLPTVKRNFN